MRWCTFPRAGNRSPPEKKILDRLLARGDRIVCCPAGWWMSG
ncbi:hypothetical protein [Pontiella desulfatans]|nr:hypothetical protein [Pontiella desulfatans]